MLLLSPGTSSEHFVSHFVRCPKKLLLSWHVLRADNELIVVQGTEGLRIMDETFEVNKNTMSL